MMTTFMDGLLPLLLQITLWSGAGLLALLVVNRYRPERLASVSLALFVGIVALSLLAYVPWPTWIGERLVETSPALAIQGEMERREPTASAASGMSFSLAWKNWQTLMQPLSVPTNGAKNASDGWGWSFWLLAVFSTGVFFGVIRLLLAFRYTRQHVVEASFVSDESVIALCSELAEPLKLRKAVRLLVTPTLQVPATLGWWTPTILLPMNWTAWSNEERRTVLSHELAHIRRADYLAMVVTQCIAIVYWFHPLVRLLSRWMKSGQELAADALAVRLHGDQSSYLQSLCRLALVQDGARLPAPARLFLSPEVSLVRRIAMLREGRLKESGSRKSSRLLVMLGLIFTVAVLASMRSFSVADEPATKPLPTAMTSWQRYVDADAPGYVVIHPAAAMSLTSMQPHRATLNRMFHDEIDVLYAVFGMGVPFDAVECIAGHMILQPRKNNEKGTGAITAEGIYFRLRTKEDAEAWIKHCIVSVEKKEHRLGTYYKAKGKPNDQLDGAFFLRPDDRTIVFAPSEEKLQRWLADAQKPTSLPAWLNGVPGDTGIITVAVNMKNEVMKKSVLQIGDDVSSNPMFKPVFDHEGSFICTLLNEDNLSFQLRFGCADAEGAIKKKTQLDGMLGMLKLLQGSGASNGTSEKDAAEMQFVVDLLKNLKTNQENNVVTFSTHSSFKIGDAIKDQIVEISGKIEKNEKEKK